MTKNPESGGNGDGRRLPHAVGLNWIASFTGPTTSQCSITVDTGTSTTSPMRAHTRHLVYYVSFIAFGLFLTALIGRHRALARGKIHVATTLRHHRLDRDRTVFARIAVRFLQPEWDQYAVYGAWPGWPCVVPQPSTRRENHRLLQGSQCTLRALLPASRDRRARHFVIVNYLPSSASKRWNLTANQQYACPSKRQAAANLDAPVTFRVFDQNEALDRYRPRLQYDTSPSGERRVHRHGLAAGPGKTGQCRYLRDDPHPVQGPHRARELRRRAGPDQRTDQGDHRLTEQGLLRPGPRRERHGGYPA